MFCNFDNKTMYVLFLEKLFNICNEVRIVIGEGSVDEIDYSNDFIVKITPYVTKVVWTRKFPGISGRGNLKVLYLKLDVNVLEVFKEYNSFFEIGYDEEREEGMDMAFYLDGNLVFLVINHCDICDLEDKYKNLFY